MPLILNPKFNPNDPKSQRYIFSGPTVINPMTGQMSDTLTGDLMQPAAPLKVETFTPTPIAPIPVAPAPVAPTAPVATDLISQIESLQQEALGAPTVKTAQITEATAKYEKQLNELNEQIRLHQARALERQEKALETGETLAFATGEAGRVARTDAIEAMKLSAMAQAVQGNIVLAEKLATSAADAQYSETLQKLTIARNNIINNWDTFTEDEKKRATTTLESIDAQDAFAKEQKQKMVDVQKVGIKAAQLGADNVLLDKILKAENVVEAERLLTESGLTKKDELLSVAEAKSLGVPYGTTESEAAEMGIVLKEEPEEIITFTNTQIMKGAAMAGISISDFQKLDIDTKNLFINRSDEIKQGKEEIDTAKESDEEPTEIEREISESNLPAAVKDYLTRYLWSIFPRPESKPEEEIEEIKEEKPWWKFW